MPPHTAQGPGEQRAVGMRTNGVGKFCDWLNHTRSLADDPAFAPLGEPAAAPGIEPEPKRLSPVTWQGKTVSEDTVNLLWGKR